MDSPLTMLRMGRDVKRKPYPPVVGEYYLHDGPRRSSIWYIVGYITDHTYQYVTVNRHTGEHATDIRKSRCTALLWRFSDEKQKSILEYRTWREDQEERIKREFATQRQRVINQAKRFGWSTRLIKAFTDWWEQGGRKGDPEQYDKVDQFVQSVIPLNKLSADSPALGLWRAVAFYPVLDGALPAEGILLHNAFYFHNHSEPYVLKVVRYDAFTDTCVDHEGNAIEVQDRHMLERLTRLQEKQYAWS